MARHPTTRRVHREPEADDAFVARVLEIAAWIRSHGRVLFMVTGVVAILGAAAFYYVNYRSTLRAQAEVRLTEIRQTIAAGNQALAIRDLEAFLTNYGNTPAAQDARLVLAQLYLDEERAADAVTLLEPVARDPGDLRGAAAAFLLAASYETLGQMDQAEAVYLSIAERARLDYERRDALDHAARLRLDAGNPAGAAELYDRLVKMMPENSEDRAFYEMRREEAMTIAEFGGVSPAAVPAPAGTSESADTAAQNS